MSPAWNAGIERRAGSVMEARPVFTKFAGEFR
jgi:hypothetical protein